MVLEDKFETLDSSKWQREVQIGGFGSVMPLAPRPFIELIQLSSRSTLTDVIRLSALTLQEWRV